MDTVSALSRYYAASYVAPNHTPIVLRRGSRRARTRRRGLWNERSHAVRFDDLRSRASDEPAGIRAKRSGVEARIRAPRPTLEADRNSPRRQGNLPYPRLAAHLRKRPAAPPAGEYRPRPGEARRVEHAYPRRHRNHSHGGSVPLQVHARRLLRRLGGQARPRSGRRAQGLWRERAALLPERKTAEQTLPARPPRSEEHTSELQSRQYLVCRLLLEKKTWTADLVTWQYGDYQDFVRSSQFHDACNPAEQLH